MRRPLQTGLLTVAAVRTLGLVAILALTLGQYLRGDAPQQPWELQQSTDGSCLVRLASRDQLVLASAIAGSAAPTRGCQVTAGPSS